MILDTLPHASRYEALNSRFALAFAFLRTVDGTQALGRHDLDGDQAFALVQTYATKPMAEAKFEAHRRYIDVQFLYQGCETVLWAPLDDMVEPIKLYDETKDAATWKLGPEATALRLCAGHFAILYPHDAHAPSIEWGRSEEVFKVVVKVAVA